MSRGIESILTIVGGTIVHADKEFAKHNPDLPPVSPEWSPVAHNGGYHNSHRNNHHAHSGPYQGHTHVPILGADGRAWQTGCSCAV